MQPKITITFDQNQYQEGSKVQGVLTISNEVAIAPQYIIIKLKAKEEIYWKVEDIFKGRRRRREYQARVTWFNHKSPFYTYEKDDMLMPGVRKLPFYFKLDESHPQTYSFVNIKNKKIRPEDEVDMLEEEYNVSKLSYEAAKEKGWMPGYPGMNFSRKDMDLISRAHATTKLKFDFWGNILDGTNARFHVKTHEFIQILQSSQRIGEILSFPIFRQTEQNLISCFCMNQGISKLKIELPKNYYDPGEELLVKVQVDNSQSNSKLSGIKLKLRKILCIKNHEGLKKVFLQEDSIQEANTRVTVDQRLISDYVEAKMILRDDLQNSIHLKIMVCCYELVVYGDYGMGDRNPKASVVIWIYKKSPEIQSGLLTDQISEPIEIIWSKNLYYDINQTKSKYNLPVWQAGLLINKDKKKKTQQPQIQSSHQQQQSNQLLFNMNQSLQQINE